jgi:hypothetical protein
LNNEQRTGLDLAWSALAAHRRLLLSTPGTTPVAEATRLRQFAVAMVETVPLRSLSSPAWWGLLY